MRAQFFVRGFADDPSTFWEKIAQTLVDSGLTIGNAYARQELGLITPNIPTTPAQINYAAAKQTASDMTPLLILGAVAIAAVLFMGKRKSRR